jgi:aryl-alcohol dehydrogenase-like predicted oxidoreductase
VLDQVAAETGKTVSQIAINWLLQNKTVSNIVIGARNEKQLLENIEATGWNLSPEHVLKLDAVSEQVPIYPHWVGKR